MSIGSTLFLKAMSYPYVTSLKEIEPLPSKPNDRRFIAERINMFGFNYKNEFSLSEVEGIKVSQHPFANFKVKDSFYFIFLKMLEDDSLRSALTVSFGNSKK